MPSVAKVDPYCSLGPKTRDRYRAAASASGSTTKAACKPARFHVFVGAESVMQVGSTAENGTKSSNAQSAHT